MAKPHRVTYRNDAGGYTVRLEVLASKDPFELLDHIHRKLFPDTTDEQRQASAKKADEILKRSRDASRVVAELDRERERRAA